MSGFIYISDENNSGVQGYTFTSAPTINDDSTQGFVINDLAVHNGITYVLQDSTPGSAVWEPITGSVSLTNNNTFTGSTTFSGPVTFDNGVLFNSIYNTPILTSNQNNYNIPDLNEFTIIVFNSDTDVDITGINSSPLSTTRQAFIFANGNVNGKKIKFKKNNGSSLAENRFFIDVDIEIREGEFWWFMYNPSQNRWNAQAKL